MSKSKYIFSEHWINFILVYTRDFLTSCFLLVSGDNIETTELINEENIEEFENQTDKPSQNYHWPEDEYIVEYSLEYGFLRLSPTTRKKVGTFV